jgi:hypothetical protein
MIEKIENTALKILRPFFAKRQAAEEPVPIPEVFVYPTRNDVRVAQSASRLPEYPGSL